MSVLEVVDEDERVVTEAGEETEVEEDTDDLDMMEVEIEDMIKMTDEVETG